MSADARHFSALVRLALADGCADLPQVHAYLLLPRHAYDFAFGADAVSSSHPFRSLLPRYQQFEPESLRFGDPRLFSTMTTMSMIWLATIDFVGG
jgi:hypothetical protein